MKPEEYFFITGCYRSGTTFLCQVLGNIPLVLSLNQPWTPAYIGAKKYFYEKMHVGSLKYLGTGFPATYEITSLNDFLTHFGANIRVENLIDTFCQEYNFDSENLIDILSFADMYKLFCLKCVSGQEFRVIGSKEILCHEFIPHYLENEIKVIVLVRNPIDMITSLNYGKGRDYTGMIRPTLLNLHNWRETVEMIRKYQTEPGLYFIRMEDLIGDPVKYLEHLKVLWGLDSSLPATIWKNVEKVNSSFNSEQLRPELPEMVKRYVQAICYKEMQWLDYQIDIQPDQVPDIIKNFSEPWEIGSRPYYHSGYSTDQRIVRAEIERWENS